MDANTATQAVSGITSGPVPTNWAIFVSYLSVLPTPIWAALLTVATAIMAATLGVRWQRRIARETLTYNTLQKLIWDNDYIMARRAFIETREGKSAQELTDLSKQKSAASPEASYIRAILNNYEIMALGVNHKVLDEVLFKRYIFGTFIQDFEGMRAFIDGSRSRNPNVYTEYEALYEKWRKP